MRLESIKLEKLFLIIFLFWGILFVILAPPFTGADECSHFWKIYCVSEGHHGLKKLTSNQVNGVNYPTVTVSVGDYIPIGMVKVGYKNIHTRFRPNDKTDFKTTKQILSQPLEKNNVVFNTFPVPSYTALSYIPSVFIMKILTLFNVPPGIILYILRFVSMFTCAILIYWSIKITPVKKLLFLALGLLPTVVYQASHVNTDGLTIGLGFLFVSFTLYLAFNNNVKSITTKNLALYMVVTVYFLLCKFTYLPMILLYFLIPTNKFDSKKQKYLFFILISISVFFTTLVLTLINSYLTAGTSYTYNRIVAYHILFNYPIIFIKAMLYTTIVHLKNCLCGFVGMFGWGETTLTLPQALSYYVLLFYAALFNDNKDSVCIDFSVKQRLNLSFIFIAFYVLLFITLFLIFQISKNGIIDCFWGRYFIPVAPVFFLIFANKQFKANRTLNTICILGINIILLISLIHIMLRFYVQ